MIPASYFFKKAYRQSWEDAELPATQQPRQPFMSGLLRPVAAGITALFARRARHHGHRFGSHAYD